MTSLAKNRKTPGVYVTEFPSFPPSIVGVETAVPMFIGYTQFAADPSSGKLLYMTPVPLSSMADYTSYFGFGFDAKGVAEPAKADATTYDFLANSANGSPNSAHTAYATTAGQYVVGTSQAMAGDVTYVAQFNLYSAMQLFFANGGGNCYVISVGDYWGGPKTKPADTPKPITVNSTDLLAGLAQSDVTTGPTMLVVPDACLMFTFDATSGKFVYAEYQKVVYEMLRQASTLQDRVAIIDMPGALIPANWTVPGMKTEANDFYTAISAAAPYFSYGAAYGPALESSLLALDDLDYTNLCGTVDSATQLNNLLTTQALSLYPPTLEGTDKILTFSDTFQTVAAHIAAAFPPTSTPTSVGVPEKVAGTTPYGTGATPPTYMVSIPSATFAAPAATDAAGILALDQYLINAVPLLGQIQQVLASQLNVVPPSGVMAGIWTLNDATRGVYNAPANMALSEIVAPKVALTDKDQGDYNVPLNGNAIDILRAMVNRGTVVWGARTLDGNSLDYRYIQVRRTLIYIEQSIKIALQQFVFAANDGGTWATVTATISNFLTQFWQAGGLMGDKASDAFSVACGVPTTMSGLDILNGYMIVNVSVQLIHPAEFIELTFSQKMQGV